jgi:shikimate dehydrogenase
MMVDASTNKYCLIGDPVKHSLSPFIMNNLFERYGLNSIYFVCRVTGDLLGDAVGGLRVLGFRGFNVTMPLKVRVIDYLDEVSPDVGIVGAVNTVINLGGKLIGYNTDWVAVRRILEKYVEDKCDLAVVFGAGGAARASLYALSGVCDDIVIVNRSYDRAVRLKQDFEGFFNELSIYGFGEDVVDHRVSNADIIINATPLGMDGVSTPVKKKIISGGSLVIDFVYKPLRTPLLEIASSCGAVSVDGLWLLLHQACEAFRIWTGIDVEIGGLRRDLVGLLV